MTFEQGRIVTTPHQTVTRFRVSSEKSAQPSRLLRQGKQRVLRTHSNKKKGYWNISYKINHHILNIKISGDIYMSCHKR